MKNLPFHWSGNNSVNRISVPTTPSTRQCAARIAPVVAAGTAAALVIRMSGSFKLVNWPQACVLDGCCAAGSFAPGSSGAAASAAPQSRVAPTKPLARRWIGSRIMGVLCTPLDAPRLSARGPLLRVVGRVDVEDVERALQADLDDCRRGRPSEVMHLGGQRDEPAGLERLTGAAVQLVAHSHVERAGE